jgi:Tol biopolymer transport system component
MRGVRRRGGVALVALLALLTLGVAACGSSSSLGAVCDDFTDVLVTARVNPTRAGATQVVLVHPDGTTARTVTGQDVVASNPSFSPTGSKVVFEQQAGVFAGAGPTSSVLAVIDLDGTGLRRITGGSSWSDDASAHQNGPYDLRPTWAPAGDTILFSHRDGDVQALYTVTPGGAPKRVIAPPAGARDVVGAWSADGHHLAFVRDLGTPGHPDQQVWTANADGSNAVEQAELHDPVDSSLMNLTWSPDGHQLSIAHPGPGAQVEPLRVLDLTTHGITESNDSSDLAWTQDGDRLYARAYSARGWQITLLRLSGGAIAEVRGIGARGPYVGAAGLDVATCP